MPRINKMYLYAVCMCPEAIWQVIFASHRIQGSVTIQNIRQQTALTHGPLGVVAVIWKVYYSISFYRIAIWHDDVIKWKRFPRYWRFVRGTHRSSVNSQRPMMQSLVFSLVCARRKGRVNGREARDFRSHRAHYDVSVTGSRWDNCH